MKTNLKIEYFDRRTGAIRREKIFAAAFLAWSYNNPLGMLVTRFILSHPFCSALYGWYHRSKISRKKIEPFIKRMEIDRQEFTASTQSFRSFAEFFIREIDLRKRPLDPDTASCVSPVDARVLAIPQISADQTFQVKRHRFNLRTFLKDDSLARQFDGGSALIFRLRLADYHHFHFPVSGKPKKTRIINGTLYAGGPYSIRYLVPFYSENLRHLTRLESDCFGNVLIVEVGAFTVGSIRQSFTPGVPVAKGDRKGHFELGGSTVVLLFQKDRIRFDNDILLNSSRKLETAVRMGERVGLATGGNN